MDNNKLLEFDIIDKIFDFLPEDINKTIFDFYNIRCPKCETPLTKCDFCEFFFCKFHICFGHTSKCSICYRHQCPYQEFYRICDCHLNKLCEKCWNRDNGDINDDDDSYDDDDDVNINNPLTTLQILNEIITNITEPTITPRENILDHIIINLDNPNITETTIDLIDITPEEEEHFHRD